MQQNKQNRNITPPQTQNRSSRERKSPEVQASVSQPKTSKQHLRNSGVDTAAIDIKIENVCTDKVEMIKLRTAVGKMYRLFRGSPSSLSTPALETSMISIFLSLCTRGPEETSKMSAVSNLSDEARAAYIEYVKNIRKKTDDGWSMTRGELWSFMKPICFRFKDNVLLHKDGSVVRSKEESEDYRNVCAVIGSMSLAYSSEKTLDQYLPYIGVISDMHVNTGREIRDDHSMAIINRCARSVYYLLPYSEGRGFPYLERYIYRMVETDKTLYMMYVSVWEAIRRAFFSGILI